MTAVIALGIAATVVAFVVAPLFTMGVPTRGQRRRRRFQKLSKKNSVARKRRFMPPSKNWTSTSSRETLGGGLRESANDTRSAASGPAAH